MTDHQHPHHDHPNEAYDKMMRGDARFRMVLTTGA